MSDSSLPIDSLSENNSGIELDLVRYFNKLSISINKNNVDSKNLNSLQENNIQSSNKLENNNCSNLDNIEMTTPPLDIKNLSIIPHFDGNPNKLHRFISATESILSHYFDVRNPDSFQNVLLLNGLLNKLEGRAEEVVAINGAKSWEQIKNTLLQNFGDQRDENCLNQDLVNLRQKLNETPFQFHERVIHLLNTICNHIDLKSDASERTLKRDFFTKQALKTFLAGLREPLGPIIRAMRPTSLVQAIQYITEEDNIKYYQKSNTQHIPPKISAPNTQNFQTFRANQFQVRPFSQQPNFHQQTQFLRPSTSNQFPRPSTSNQFPQPSTSNQFPRGPVNVQRHPNPPPQKFPTNAQVFGKPQNVWKPNMQAPQPKPTPMSVSTRNTTPQFRNQQQNNYFRNNGQKPNFVSEELFHTECDEQQQAEYDPESNEESYENYYTAEADEQNENFREPQIETEER